MAESMALLVTIGFFSILLILLMVFIMRWIFKIETMVNCQQMQVALLAKLAQKAGATDQELINTITPASDQKTAKRIVNAIK